jgi:hypothetical protein
MNFQNWAKITVAIAALLACGSCCEAFLGVYSVHRWFSGFDFVSEPTLVGMWTSSECDLDPDCSPEDDFFEITRDEYGEYKIDWGCDGYVAGDLGRVGDSYYLDFMYVESPTSSWQAGLHQLLRVVILPDRLEFHGLDEQVIRKLVDQGQLPGAIVHGTDDLLIVAATDELTTFLETNGHWKDLWHPDPLVLVRGEQ